MIESSCGVDSLQGIYYKKFFDKVYRHFTHIDPRVLISCMMAELRQMAQLRQITCLNGLCCIVFR